MREKDIEQKLVQAVKLRNGICPKFTSANYNGMPDRLVLLPYGKLAFVELKAPGKKSRALQLSRHMLLRRLGFNVFTINDKEQIGVVLDEIQSA